MMFDQNCKISGTSESEKRKREIQLLLNIVEPDPEYQPFFLTDEASLLDCVGTEEKKISERLSFYFSDCGIDIIASSLTLPIWKLVDRIKEKYSKWPDD